MSYTEVNTCIFCNGSKLTKVLDKDLYTPMGCYTVDDNTKSHSMPFNILLCEGCLTCQTAYRGDLDIIYNYNSGFFGSIRTDMNILFADFISNNKNIKDIVEIGAGHGILSDIIIQKNKLNYTIFDPTYSGTIENKTIIKEFINDGTQITGDALIMSHVFEHFYKPLDILEKIFKSSIKYIYLNQSRPRILHKKQLLSYFKYRTYILHRNRILTETIQ
jgi:hypothetical protein